MAFDTPHIFLIKALTIKGHRLTSACWRFCIHILKTLSKNMQSLPIFIVGSEKKLCMLKM